MLGYPVLMTEYERGWGSRPDGYLIFPSDEARKAYVTEATKGYTGPAPDYYVSYSNEPVVELSAETQQLMEASTRGHIYVDRLFERRKVV